jgi:membrane protein YqaA with SNARE-associated domain
MIDLFSDPRLWLLITFFSIIGAFARLPNYYAGLRGKDVIMSIYPRIKPETWLKVTALYQNLGPIPLLVASIPFIGSLLTVGAGIAGIGRNRFIILVAFSKIIRNWILVWIIWSFL